MTQLPFFECTSRPFEEWRAMNEQYRHPACQCGFELPVGVNNEAYGIVLLQREHKMREQNAEDNS